MTTQNNKNIDTTFIKESYKKTTYIPEETEGFTDYRSTIFKESTIFIQPETIFVDNTFLKEKYESTIKYLKDTTDILESLFNTSYVQTTLINKPTTELLFDTSSSIKESTKDIPDSSKEIFLLMKDFFLRLI